MPLYFSLMVPCPGPLESPSVFPGPLPEHQLYFRGLPSGTSEKQKCQELALRFPGSSCPSALLNAPTGVKVPKVRLFFYSWQTLRTRLNKLPLVWLLPSSSLLLHFLNDFAQEIKWLAPQSLAQGLLLEESNLRRP